MAKRTSKRGPNAKTATPKIPKRRNSEPSAEFLEKWQLAQAVAKAQRKLAPPITHGPEALAELRKVTEQLIERKPRAPAKQPLAGGLGYGPASFVRTPPYDDGLFDGFYGIGPSGNAEIVAQPNVQAGAMRCEATTLRDKPSHGYGGIGLQLTFLVPFGPSRVTIRPAVEIVYGYVLNSLSTPAYGLAEMRLEVHDAHTQAVLASSIFFDWVLYSEGTLKFDLGSVPNPGWFVAFDAPASDIYYMQLGLICGVIGDGWPKSVANVQFNVQIPSVTFEVAMRPQQIPVHGAKEPA